MKGLLFTMVLMVFGGLERTIGQTIGGFYCGAWGKTTWEYDFKKDGSFSFQSSGHFGNTHSSGEYSIKGDTLILNSVLSDTIDEKGFYTIRNHQFLMDADSCIISLGTGYDYCKTHRKALKASNSEETLYYIGNSRKRIMR